MEASACDDVLRPLTRTGERKGQFRIISSTVSNGPILLKILKESTPALLSASCTPQLFHIWQGKPCTITCLPQPWSSLYLRALGIWLHPLSSLTTESLQLQHPGLPAENRNHLLGTTLCNTSSMVAGKLSWSIATKQDWVGHPRQTTTFATFVLLVRKFSISLSDTFQNFIMLCQEVVPLANFSLACGTLSPTSLSPTEMENN